MKYFVLLPVGISLLLYILPALLFKRSTYAHARDYLVSQPGTTDDVFQNSSLAYAMQLATFGPFFAWGLAGDWIPGVLNSAFFCLGLSLFYFGRHHIANFVRSALSADRSITIHEFLAHSHGDSRWLRLVASCLTVVALWGIVMAEMFGIATVAGPLFGTSPTTTYFLVIVLFLLMFVYSALGGNDGVMRIDQLQLGFAYCGLIGATIGLIVLIAPKTPNTVVPAAIAVIFFGLFSIVWLALRRLRFVSSHPIDQSLEPRWRVYLGLERFVGLMVVVLVVSLLFTVGWFVIHSGPANIVSSASAAVTSTTSFSWLALVAIAILPLGYQIVDITNWQRFASAGQEETSSRGPGRRALIVYVLEAPLIWVSLLAFGALAGGLFQELSKSASPFGDFVASLSSSTGWLTGLTLALFMVAVFAIGLSTMDAVFSATQAAFQYDILPALRANAKPPVQQQVRATRLFGLVSYFVVIALFYAAERLLTFGRDSYVAILLAFYSAQMAFIPLVVGAFVARQGGRSQASVSSSFAIAALILGAAMGIIPTFAALLTTPSDLLLWGSIPACLIVSSSVYLVGWMTSRNSTTEVS